MDAQESGLGALVDADLAKEIGQAAVAADPPAARHPVALHRQPGAADPAQPVPRDASRRPGRMPAAVRPCRSGARRRRRTRLPAARGAAPFHDARRRPAPRQERRRRGLPPAADPQADGGRGLRPLHPRHPRRGSRAAPSTAPAPWPTTAGSGTPCMRAWRDPANALPHALRAGLAQLAADGAARVRRGRARPRLHRRDERTHRRRPLALTGRRRRGRDTSIVSADAPPPPPSPALADRLQARARGLVRDGGPSRRCRCWTGSRASRAAPSMQPRRSRKPCSSSAAPPRRRPPRPPCSPPATPAIRCCSACAPRRGSPRATIAARWRTPRNSSSRTPPRRAPRRCSAARCWPPLAWTRPFSCSARPSPLRRMTVRCGSPLPKPWRPRDGTEDAEALLAAVDDRPFGRAAPSETVRQRSDAPAPWADPPHARGDAEPSCRRRTPRASCTRASPP